MAEKSKAGHRQRLRERFLAGAQGSRSQERLLELLLTFAIARKDVRPIAIVNVEEDYQVCVRMLARAKNESKSTRRSQRKN
jgi:DNA repair protein RadC